MPDRPPIIIRKKIVHNSHHGGAWKVAYADFVTAMMSLFIVLWLMNSSASVKDAVAGYFKDPKGTGKLTGSDKAGKGPPGTGRQPTMEISKDDMPRLKEQLEKSLATLRDFQKLKNQVAITLAPEGLRIEMMETDSGMFFGSGSSKATPLGDELLRNMASELGRIPNRLVVEGHTDAQPYSGFGAYSNWELSADRANQARQVMQASGLRDGQVLQVRGFADQNLRDTEHPKSAANRRISVIVRYDDAKEPQVPEAKPDPKQQSAGPPPPTAK